MMKLVIILIVCFIHFAQPKECNILGKISKNIKQTTESNYYCVYLDTKEFPNDAEISIKATIYNGTQKENFMYYIGNILSKLKIVFTKILKIINTLIRIEVVEQQ